MKRIKSLTKRLAFLVAFALVTMLSQAQPLQFTSVKFHANGDNAAWTKPAFDDRGWSSVDPNKSWLSQGINITKNFGWYRLKFVLHKKDFQNKSIKYGLNFCMKFIDDCDETYLNGKLIGKTGCFPSDPNGYSGEWDTPRNYNISANSPLIRWEKENILVVKVYSEMGDGGIYGAPVSVEPVSEGMSGLNMTLNQRTFDSSCVYDVSLANAFDCVQKGNLTFTSVDAECGKEIQTQTRRVKVGKKGEVVLSFTVPNTKTSVLSAVYRDGETGKEISRHCRSKYILTPKAPATPRINNALVFGVRPNSPVILKIAATGERPMRYAVENMPAGLVVDSVKGVITGSLPKGGDYDVTLVAKNTKGIDRRKITFKVGGTIALTPAMGWNSWNCWGLSVSQDKVMASAQAMLDKGLADYGFTYINIDDAWEADERDAQGHIQANSKFKDMKGLGSWLHANGLKFGIYSSPGEMTCGGYPASLNYEKEDADTYNAWGIDYLKYDFCSYGAVYDAGADKSAAAFVRPYLKMEGELRRQPRDIFYSVAWGAPNVCRWAYGVDGNSWRTTDDIQDNWKSVYHIGFEQQAELYPFSMPGHWNDPDMLVVGKVGWGGKLRDSRLTADEQYSHISLWTLLASNMLIGCDISQMDEFTLGLLTNAEVNAIDQDILGKQAKPEVIDDSIQIWKRPLYDGAYAVGIFNVSGSHANVAFSKYFPKLGIEHLKSVRDLWRQKNLSTSETSYSIPAHGVIYLKIRY